MVDGPLTEKVQAYSATVRQIVPVVRDPDDWAPLAEFVAVDDFERIGTFLEVQDWGQYTEMLTGWASAIDSFDTTVRRITEVPGLVYYEVEERHHAGDRTTVVNSLTVFDFDDDGLIRHLDVFLQQARSTEPPFRPNAAARAGRRPGLAHPRRSPTTSGRHPDRPGTRGGHRVRS